MNEWYNKWCARHARMFGMTSAGDVETFAEWWTVFTSMGYTETELNSATNAIAARIEPLDWRRQHLAAINRHIADLRTAAVQKRYDELKRQGESPEKTWCELCKDTGQVIVPHPKYILDGIWVQHGSTRPTCSVLCTCLRGNKIYEAQVAKGMGKTQLRLSAYEERFSRNLWRSWFVEQAGLQAQTARVQEHTELLDKRLGVLPVRELIDAARAGNVETVLDSAKKTRSGERTPAPEAPESPPTTRTGGRTRIDSQCPV